MKIFFCETYDDGTVGGSHSCMYNLIKRMPASQFKFTVGFVGKNAYVNRYKDLGIDVDILPFGRPVIKENAILRKIRNWLELNYNFKKYLLGYFRSRKYDLVVLNNSIFVSLPYVYACKKLGIPVIIYERGIGFFRREHIRATKQISATIAISDAVLRFLQENNFRTRIIARIYDGIDPSAFSTTFDLREVKASLALPPESKVVGIVGNIRPWKGQEYFVRAFLRLAKQHKDLYALVIGGWSKEDKDFQSGLRRIAEKAGLQDRLLFLGYRDDIQRIMSIFDIFVHASTKPEPFGMVLLEAMASKVPVIATNRGGPVEILDGGKFGILVPPKDSNSIKEGCNRYLNNSSFRQQMIEKAYERVLSEFHITRTVEQTAELFERIVG